MGKKVEMQCFKPSTMPFVPMQKLMQNLKIDPSYLTEAEIMTTLCRAWNAPNATKKSASVASQECRGARRLQEVRLHGPDKGRRWRVSLLHHQRTQSQRRRLALLWVVD